VDAGLSLAVVLLLTPRGDRISVCDQREEQVGRSDFLPKAVIAFVALFNLKGKLVQRLADLEVREDARKARPRAMSGTNSEDPQTRSLALTVERGRLLRRKILLSFAWIVGASLIPFVIALAGGSFSLTQFRTQAGLGVGSVVAFSVATLGRLGWAGQSYKGDTAFERLDNRILWVLYGLGAALGVAAFLF